MTMKRISLYPILSIIFLSFITSCNNDDNKEDFIVDGKVNATKAIQFNFNISDYNEEQEVDGTRVEANEIIHRENIDLGNGMSAQVSVQKDITKSTPTTRVMPNGNYTMLAYDASQTLKGEIKGTVSGGVFTATSTNQDILLEPGSYEFVCYNDKVIRSGNNLIVTKDNAKEALIGREPKNITATPKKQIVLFDMRRVASRIRVKLTGWLNFPAVTATLESVNSTDVPSSTIYNAATGTWTNGPGGAVSENLTYPASPNNPSADKLYQSTSKEYLYFNPNIDLSKLKLTLTSGQIYRLPMSGMSLVLKELKDGMGNKITTSPQTAYLINIKLTYNFLYLMSDGSKGFYDDTTFGGGTKTPIAVILSQSNRIAMALNDANGGATTKWCSANYFFTQTNTHMVPTTNPHDIITTAATSGKEETWNPGYTHSNVVGEKIKAKNSDFPAFNVAANYNPGATYTGSPALVWYLPSASDFKWMYSTLGLGDKTEVNKTEKSYNWYGALANVAFRQVGGTDLTLSSGSSKNYTSSSEFGDGGFMNIIINEDYVFFRGYNKWAADYYVRPFLAY